MKSTAGSRVRIEDTRLFCSAQVLQCLFPSALNLVFAERQAESKTVLWPAEKCGSEENGQVSSLLASTTASLFRKIRGGVSCKHEKPSYEVCHLASQATVRWIQAGPCVLPASCAFGSVLAASLLPISSQEALTECTRLAQNLSPHMQKVLLASIRAAAQLGHVANAITADGAASFQTPANSPTELDQGWYRLRHIFPFRFGTHLL